MQLPVLVDSSQHPMFLMGNDSIAKDLDISVQRIPVHPFTMGCTAIHERTCEENERPAHKVSLKRDFWMMTSEVTQQLYERVMYVNPSAFQGEQLPVEKVSWHDAIRFANRLSQIEGRERCCHCV